MRRVEYLEAWLVESDDGEGVPAFREPMARVLMPMVGDDLERIADLRPFAQAVANQYGRVVRRVRFRREDELEALAPEEADGVPDSVVALDPGAAVPELWEAGRTGPGLGEISAGPQAPAPELDTGPVDPQGDDR